jgi:hypothetical protein
MQEMRNAQGSLYFFAGHCPAIPLSRRLLQTSREAAAPSLFPVCFPPFFAAEVRINVCAHCREIRNHSRSTARDWIGDWMQRKIVGKRI